MTVFILMGALKMTFTEMVEDGYPKLVTTSDIKGRGVYGNSDITTKQEEIMFLFSFFACFWSERQQLSLG